MIGPIPATQAAADALDDAIIALQALIGEAQSALRVARLLRDRVENLPLGLAVA